MSSRSAVRLTRLGRVVLTLLFVCGVVVGSVLIWRVTRGDPPRIFRTVQTAIYAAALRSRYSLWTSCGVR
jgi:hypothetical protein